MSLLKARVHQKIYEFLFMLLVFLIPIHQRFLSIIIALIIVNWILEWDFKVKISRIKEDENRFYNLGFIILYLLYLLGLIYSENLKYGMFDLEVKLSLIIFPVIFSTLPQGIFKREKTNYLIKSWIAGNIVATIVCIVCSLLRFSSTNNFNEFYYSRLSVLLHPGYFAMYLNLTIVFLIHIVHNSWNTLSKIEKFLYPILSLWIFVFIILLSSKAGIISLALILITYILFYFITTRKVFRSLSFLFLTVIIFLLSLLIFPRSYGRIEKASEVIANPGSISNDTKEGTAERILIWKASLSIIRNNFFFGLGTGDIKDGLVKVYKDKGYSTAQERRLNAHNQYLQTFISIGIIGFLVLILSFLMPAVYSIKGGDIIYLLFLIIIAFNFLVESMLERQAGVIFYAFFNSYFFLIKKRP